MGLTLTVTLRQHRKKFPALQSAQRDGMRASLPVALLVACLGALGALAQAPNWALVDQTILAGMVNVTPGVVAIVGTKSGIVYAKPFGRLTYGIPPPFDASDPPMTLTVRIACAPRL